MPQRTLVFSSWLKQMPQSELRSLCGNGMSLIQLGSCCLSALSTFEKRHEGSCRPEVAGSEKPAR
eukprot:10085326-Lingulodinium_polyedra.AAC.1